MKLYQPRPSDHDLWTSWLWMWVCLRFTARQMELILENLQELKANFILCGTLMGQFDLWLDCWKCLGTYLKINYVHVFVHVVCNTLFQAWLYTIEHGSEFDNILKQTSLNGTQLVNTLQQCDKSKVLCHWVLLRFPSWPDKNISTWNNKSTVTDCMHVNRVKCNQQQALTLVWTATRQWRTIRRRRSRSKAGPRRQVGALRGRRFVARERAIFFRRM